MVKWACLGIAGVSFLAAFAPSRTSGVEATKAREPAMADWSELKPLAIKTPFENVRYPHLDARGNVTFIADDALSRESTGGNHGIFRYQGEDKSLVCLVRGGETTVPGEEATLKTIQGLQMDQNSVDFVFNAFDSAGKRGLYHWSKGELDIVARTTVTILPGDTNPITSVEYGSLYGNNVLYKASSPHLGAVLVLHDLATGQDRVVCHSGMPIPGGKEETFKSIGSTNWVSGDSIIFRAGSTPNPRASDARGTQGVYGWFGIRDWSAASGEFTPERLRTIVDGSAPVPIGDVDKDATFNVIGSAPVSENTTVFQASGDNFNGIFIAKTPDGPIRCVVSSHTEFGGPFKGRFTGFGAYPAIIGQNVVFVAEAAEDVAPDAVDGGGDADDAKADDDPQPYRGIFVYRLDRGELFTLASNRAPLEGKEIVDMEIGGHVLVDNHFVVTVTFKDKTSQIFLGTIKPDAFRQLTGAAAVTVPKKPE